jgi:hypothetical protein
MDEFGVFAVDTEPHLIVPFDSVENNQSMRGKILSIGSQGGGIYVYEALQASAGMIAGAKAQTRHIILFADAADSRQHPGNYREIVNNLRQADVTVSVVGMGTEADPDADILKDVAQLGGGTCYFAASVDEIPRLFAQDTFTVARSTFVDEPTAFQFTAGYSLLGAQPPNPPPLGGYNLCYLRPEGNLAAVSADDYKAPVVSSRIAGIGRVACFTGEADGKFSGSFAAWDQTGEFYSTLARWTMGKRERLPADQLLTEQVRDGVCFVQLHLDPERKADPFAALPRVRVLHGLPGVPPQTVAVEERRPARSSDSDHGPRNGPEHGGNSGRTPGHAGAGLSAVLAGVCAGPTRPRRGDARATGDDERRPGTDRDSGHVGRSAIEAALHRAGAVVAGGVGDFISSGNFRTPHRLGVPMVCAQAGRGRRAGRGFG